MSLVGPRPPLPNEVDQYEIRQRRRLSMKPGLTCFWQIAPHRNDLTFDQWMRLPAHRRRRPHRRRPLARGQACVIVVIGGGKY